MRLANPLSVPAIHLLFAWLLGPLACSQAAAAEPATQPNIILIMADDVGYECFGCYGSKQYATPNLDRLAAQGIRFRHAYAQPLCTPSRVKIMTGLSNVRNYSGFSILNRDQKTFADYLLEQGYRTAVVGKWQLYGARHYSEQFRGQGTLPPDAGFENYCLWQVEELGSRFDGPLLNIDGEHHQFDATAYGPDVATDYLLDFMAAESDRPFFAYFPMILVHNPFVPTPDTEDRTSKNKQRHFEDMVAYMDKLVGRIVAQTEKLGIADNTLLLFTGDNGTNQAIRSTLDGKQIRGGKGLMTDAGTRVPLIAYWPGTIAPGRVSDDLIEFSDFLPTLTDAAGAPTPAELDGQSFFPQLLGRPGNARESIYIYYCPRPERTPPSAFARDQRWKLYDDGRLFDVPADALEQHPLAEPLSAPAQAARTELQAVLDSMPSKGQNLLKFTTSGADGASRTD